MGLLDHARNSLGVGATTLALTYTFTPLPASADTWVASWNIRNLGWGESKDYSAVARVAATYDLIAIQEVMSEDGIRKLEQALESLTGREWDVLVSHAIGRGSYKEHYAFIYDPSEVTWTGGAVVYVDDRDAFAREPFSAQFETVDGYEFVLASVHVIYGDDVAERQREVRALSSYRSWLTENFSGKDIYIAGDFNLPPTDRAWDAEGVGSYPLISDGATTLGEQDGRFVNLYDNIWAPAGAPLPLAGWGIDPYPARALGMSHSQARETVSDHVPVWMRFDSEGPTVILPSWVQSDGVANIALENTGDGQGEIVVNKNSGIYHLPGCPNYDTVATSNRQLLKTETEAISLGYRRAGNC